MAERKTTGKHNPEFVYQEGALVLGITTGAALLCWASRRFHTASSSQVLVRSGAMIKALQVGNSFLRLPYQFVTTIPLQPTSHSIELAGMSSQKMPFLYSGAFTTAPRNTPEGIAKYATLMHPLDLEKRSATIKGIIEGQARSLAAGLTMEELFSGRESFKTSLVEQIQTPLDRLGLELINANLRALSDDEGSSYFRELSKSIQAAAVAEAQIAVAEARKSGTIGEAERTRDTKIRVAQLDAESKVQENKRQEEVLKSNAALAKTRAESKLIADTAMIESEAQAEILKSQREAVVQVATLEAQTEQERAQRLSKMRVDAEVLVRQTEGDAKALNTKTEAEATAHTIATEAKVRNLTLSVEGQAANSRTLADVKLFEATRVAEANLVQMIKAAEGKFIQTAKEAEGKLLMATREATGALNAAEAKAAGEQKILTAQALGFEQLSKVLGRPENLLHYLSIDRGVIKDVADAGARSLKDMKPNVTIWTPSGSAAFDSLRSFVPSMDTIQRQTGFALPEWLVKNDGIATEKAAPKSSLIAQASVSH